MTKVLVSCKQSRIESNLSFYSSFILGPFHASESLTLANSVRRVLLSELSGIAIISVQIEGVVHEYSNLPGIKNSVLDILLKIREIVLKKVSKTIRPQIGYLCARGPGIITAGDLCLPPFIQCVDPTQPITELTQDGFLNMKFIIAEGNNYVKGKSKMFVDFDEFKKRRLRLKKLNKTCQNSLILKNYYLYLRKKLNRKLDDQKLARAKVFLELNPQNFTLIKENQNNDTIKKYNSHYIKKNSLILKSLNVDAVFNPITNVNCITKANEHKIVEDLFFKATTLENDLTTLKTKPLLYLSLEKKILKLKKSNLEKKFIPKLGKKLFNDSECTYLKKLLLYQINLTNFQNLIPKTKTLELNKKDLSLNLPINLLKKNINSIKNTIKLSKNNIFNEFNSTTGSKKIQTGLHKLKKDTIFNHYVIIEVWTNGSVHPREAITEAFKYLIKLLNKLKQIKLIQPFVKSTATNINLIREFKNNLNTLLPLNQQIFLGKYRGFQEYQLKKTENFLGKNKLNVKTKNIISKKEFKFNVKMPKKKILLEKKEKNKLNTKNINKQNLKNNLKISNIKNTSKTNTLNKSKNIENTSKTKTLNKSKNIENTSKTNTVNKSNNIEILNISLRTVIALKKKNINTIKDLLELTKNDLFNIPNIGQKSIEEIEKILLNIGLNLKIN